MLMREITSYMSRTSLLDIRSNGETLGRKGDTGEVLDVFATVTG
jgi:hypothetical protein